MQLVSQGKGGVRSVVEIEFVKARDGRPADLPPNLINRLTPVGEA